ncbi:unnamed protein product [Mytilus coruscus]|uniref:Uncharacterized protein n=1 Tax=Mytilus coruscus TaxID=42192 RepID=A0A6J8EC74_MYTCO|nr:unnamed protein product [Mytilus coruscus]
MDTCPNTDIIPSTRVAKMCQTTTALENDEDGNDIFDSVFLSLIEQANNCYCNMSIKNVTTTVDLYINRLNNLTERLLCGMEIDIYLKEYPGKAMKTVFFEISCDGPPVTTPLDTFTQPRKTLNDVTTSLQITPILSSSTTMIATSPIHDETDSDGDSTLYIALGTVGGLIICVSVLVVIFLYKRQLSITEADPGDNRNMQYDSLSGSRNTLNYSTLNRTSEDIDEQQYETVNSNVI